MFKCEYWEFDTCPLEEIGHNCAECQSQKFHEILKIVYRDFLTVFSSFFVLMEYHQKNKGAENYPTEEIENIIRCFMPLFTSSAFVSADEMLYYKLILNFFKGFSAHCLVNLNNVSTLTIQ